MFCKFLVCYVHIHRVGRFRVRFEYKLSVQISSHSFYVQELEGTVNEAVNREVIWERLDDDSKSLVNSWLDSEINENVVAQDTSDTFKRDVLIRNKELGLVPVDEWAKGLFETAFDSNPNLMTDDEYKMIFGEER